MNVDSGVVRELELVNGATELPRVREVVWVEGSPVRGPNDCAIARAVLKRLKRGLRDMGATRVRGRIDAGTSAASDTPAVARVRGRIDAVMERLRAYHADAGLRRLAAELEARGAVVSDR